MTVAEETPTDALLDGRYRLIERVGAGGSGEVHRAEDVILGRTVAVKVLRGEHESILGGDRVRRETEVLAALNHPSIVTLHDAQLAPGRTQYLVMEYVEGRTLAQELARGAMEPAHVALLAHDLAEALGVLHARRLIHRDVSPRNLRRTPEGVIKLIDFGALTAFGAPGGVVGTPPFVAPETLNGNPNELTDNTGANRTTHRSPTLSDSVNAPTATPAASEARAANVKIVADEASRYGEQFEIYKAMRPGITGIWQVERHSGTTYDERVAMDVEYYQKASAAFDISLLFATAKQVMVAGGSG